MSKELYVEKKFSAGSLALIKTANDIIAEYQAAGFVLTLRQLYYQFVARDKLANNQREYKRLGSVINDGRLAGLIDWESIEDRTRNLRKLATWDSPKDILSAVSDQYRIDRWKNQSHRVECWIEKDALVGVIEGVCNEFRVPYFACRGYSSQSEQWRAGKRFNRYGRADQKIVVLHLGDHDPSGIDMTRDNADRLDLLSRYAPVEVRRLALNMDQVQQYGPPPNPAKLSDSRATDYIALHGDESWELDALEPQTIETLIRDQIESLIDPDPWEADAVIEDTERTKLAAVAENWV